MCGGIGSRLDADVEKPLVPVDGEPMVDRVVAALDESTVENVFAVTSLQAPNTRDHVTATRLDTPGEDYVADLQTALADARVEPPVLTAAADLPLLTASVVDDVLDRWDGGSLIVTVPASLKRELGVSVDSSFRHDGHEVVPSGLNVVVGDPERVVVVEDERLAVNVNHAGDLEVARRLVA